MNQFFMLLLKNNPKPFLTLLFIFTSFWIYKIFAINWIVGLVIIITCLIIALKPDTKFVAVSILVLLFFQFQTTQVKSLTLLDNDGQRVQQERIRAYPLTYIQLFSKTLWLKPEIWIEQNNLVIASSRLEGNFFENLDLNKYFFAGFPRNNLSDYPKFFFLFLIPFILGIFTLIKEKQYKILLILFLLPLVLLSFFGNDNLLGPFCLVPFFILSFVTGFEKLIKIFK